MDLTRREFLIWSGALLGTAILPGCARLPALPRAPATSAPPPHLGGKLPLKGCPAFAGARMGSLVMPSLKTPNNSFGGTYPDSGNVLSVIDFAGKEIRWVATPLRRSHSAMQAPLLPGTVAVFEKDGPQGCLVDIRRPSVTRVLHAKPGWNFNGHGAFSTDGTLLYDTEYNIADKDEGAIVIRDGRTFEILGELDSHGYQPHDLRFLKGGAQMAVAHYGHIPTDKETNLEASLTLLEMPSGKLIERVSSTGHNFQLCHVATTNDGRWIVSTQNFLNRTPDMKGEGVRLDQLSQQEQLNLKQTHYPSPVMIGAFGKEARSIMPKELEKQYTFNFSTVIHEETSVAAVAHISGNYVSFWNLDEAKMIIGHDVKASATGLAISLDRNWFIASSGAVLHFFDVKELKHRAFLPLGPNLSAPHILTV